MCLRENEGYDPDLKVAWGRANRLTPFLNSVYSSVQKLGSEIGQVSSILVECGLHTLPLTNGRKRQILKDEVLNNLCALSKDAWKV